MERWKKEKGEQQQRVMEEQQQKEMEVRKPQSIQREWWKCVEGNKEARWNFRRAIKVQ